MLYHKNGLSKVLNLQYIKIIHFKKLHATADMNSLNDHSGRC